MATPSDPEQSEGVFSRADVLGETGSPPLVLVTGIRCVDKGGTVLRASNFCDRCRGLAVGSRPRTGHGLHEVRRPDQ